MNLVEIAYYGIRNLQSRQLRSSLTIIGIVLGIATIVTLMSIGEGVRQDIEGQLSQFGTQTIFVVPFSMNSFQSASSVSLTCSSMLSSLLVTAAMPPCA